MPLARDVHIDVVRVSAEDFGRAIARRIYIYMDGQPRLTLAQRQEIPHLRLDDALLVVRTHTDGEARIGGAARLARRCNATDRLQHPERQRVSDERMQREQ